MAAMDRPALAEVHDYPPVFATARHQFTLIEPSVQMPAVTLPNLKGRPARLGATPGRITLINFWATWCQACQWDLPLLERFHDVMGKEVKVAAVSTDAPGQANAVRDYLDRLSIRSLPVFLDDTGQLGNSTPGTKAPFPLSRGMPATYLVTPSGRIAGYILGVADWLSADARSLLRYYANA
ncbi:thiol:disulfide interchange protein [Rhizobium freirei PRF 81]|uniref:Thiol:disulfide interchange protein n=1 Tax=Rhizobium freirei PRF 81 TaxID=363754 RepID=N6UVC5_9HYPH|nr:TlpA disulfide reductase family protein [Rhizobium freirei]ENN84711.1 thiol:disulfide interchange protein [Rhizobium freirei PRF 81]